MVILNPTTHTYLDADNNVYKSVTTLIKEFVPHFDFEKKSKQYASKYGLDVEEVRDSWRLKNKQSTDFGTKIHKEIETLISEGSYTGEKDHKEIIESIVDTLKKNFKPGDFLLEHVVFNKEVKIAGTADVIVDRPDSFSVLDFKTNKDFKIQSMYEKFLTGPVSHLPNGEFFKYSLQLSFYAHFYSLMTGKMVDRLCVFWLDRGKNNKNYDTVKDSKWVRYNLPYLKEEVLSCLEYAAKS